MATYVLLSSLTPEGGQSLHAHPDRLAEVNEEIDNFGCSVVAVYVVLGPYDFLTIVDAPDNETIAHLSVDLGSCDSPDHHVPRDTRRRLRQEAQRPKSSSATVDLSDR